MINIYWDWFNGNSRRAMIIQPIGTKDVVWLADLSYSSYIKEKLCNTTRPEFQICLTITYNQDISYIY